MVRRRRTGRSREWIISVMRTEVSSSRRAKRFSSMAAGWEPNLMVWDETAEARVLRMSLMVRVWT